jgi:cell division protein ZapA
MTDEASVNTITIELLGKPYPIKCPESELESLLKAAEYLNKKMSEVQASGKVINLERIAIITALNMAYELLQAGHQKEGIMQKINQRILKLQSKLDEAINQVQQSELIYTSE